MTLNSSSWLLWMNSSLSEDFQGFMREMSLHLGPYICRPPFCSRDGGRDHRPPRFKRISNSKTEKKKCIHSELPRVLSSSAKSKLECKLTPDSGQFDMNKHPPLFVLSINSPTFHHNHTQHTHTHNHLPHYTDKHSLRIKSAAR